MTLLRLFDTNRSAQRQTELAADLASRNQFAIERRLVGLSASMSRAEQQGYVRARAALIVRRAVRYAIADKLARPSEEDKLVELTMEAVLASVGSRRQQAAPRRMAA